MTLRIIPGPKGDEPWGKRFGFIGSTGATGKGENSSWAFFSLFNSVVNAVEVIDDEGGVTEGDSIWGLCSGHKRKQIIIPQMMAAPISEYKFFCHQLLFEDSNLICGSMEVAFFSRLISIASWTFPPFWKWKVFLHEGHVTLSILSLLGIFSVCPQLSHGTMQISLKSSCPCPFKFKIDNPLFPVLESVEFVKVNHRSLGVWVPIHSLSLLERWLKWFL